MKMYAIIYKHYECTVLAGVAEQADAADLKSADTRVSYRFKSGHRHHTVPKDNRQIQYRGVEQLVARRAHNPEAVWFKSHLRNQKRFHSRYNFGYGILLYIRKMPCFRPKTAHFCGFEGVFSLINDKSAILCPGKTEAADFVSFKGSIVQGMNLQKNIVLCRKK